jgi:hypothetical protein
MSSMLPASEDLRSLAFSERLFIRRSSQLTDINIGTRGPRDRHNGDVKDSIVRFVDEILGVLSEILRFWVRSDLEVETASDDLL